MTLKSISDNHRPPETIREHQGPSETIMAESTKRGISGSRIPRKVLPSEEGFVKKSRSSLRVPELNELASLSEAASLSKAIELSEPVVLSEATSLSE